MNTADAELWDWMRILIGEAPPIFLLEVVLRVIVVYLILVISMRLMGKRMSSMISRNEMLAMVSLAAAIGIPIQDPARGLIPAFIIAAVVIGFQYLISINTRKSARFEHLIVGNTGALVLNGTLNLQNMKKSKISRERLLSEIRGEEITNLGRIERIFLEANGKFTIYTFAGDDTRKGLCILPEWDKEFLDEMEQAGDAFACGGCGNLEENAAKPENSCGNCGQQQWYRAIAS